MEYGRKINSHKVNPCNESLEIDVMDAPGAGGANHEYRLTARKFLAGESPERVFDLSFQNGPIPEVGTNGVTHEALIAIVIDRLRSFQSGPFACRENALALTKLEEALHWLHHRTRERAMRGVEGTLNK